MAGRILEICCDSLESAIAAVEGGADRIELCVDLPADGLTPPGELLAAVKVAVGIPVFVMVRCRAGRFVFSESEVATMCAQIDRLRGAGADGIVCGALTASGGIDQLATRRFLDAAAGLPFTFHKAFDACDNSEIEMEALVELGVDRVLTSGGARRAVDARERLAKLAEIGGSQTQVLCGGGVRSGNLEQLMKIPGVTEFHSAARHSVSQVVDVAEVRGMKDAISGAAG